jgi:hypothetical protein
MGFKKIIKRISALGIGASMVGATIFGAMAADLADYPSQFIADGKFTGVLVVGDKASAEDVIGVSDIAVSLQFAATKAVSVAEGGALTAEGDAWLVQKGSTNVLEMSENLESASAGSNRETIATITGSSYIDDAELPSLLAAGTTSNTKGNSPYEQRLYFENNNETGFVQYLEDREDVTGDFLYFSNGKQIARYELEFTTSLESDVDDSAGSATSTGDYLTDIEDVEITMLGKEYVVVTARRNSGKVGQVILTLMGGAVHDTMLEGATKTYTIDGTDYEVSLTFVSATQSKFTVNGESTRLLKDGDTDKLSDGTTVGISEILYQNYAGGVHSSTFFLGAQKLWIKDTNINNTASSNEMKVDDETIDGSNVWIEGSDDSTTFKIDKIVVNMTADDDYYVPAGGKLSENPEMSEPELLFTKSWDIEYKGLSDESVNEIRIKASGSDDYELEFVDGSGNKAKIPLINAVASSVIRFGDTNDDLIVQENKTITKDDYFVITDESDTNGERKSYALRYRGADKITADNPVIKFDDQGSGERITRTLSTPNSQVNSDGVWRGGGISEVAQIKLGGGIYRVYNVTTAASKDFNILVDLDASGALTIEGVSINTKYGALVNVTNISTGSTSSPLDVQVYIETPNSDDYDDKAPKQLGFNMTASAGEVRLALTADQIHAFRAPDDDDKNTYAYTTYGAFVKRSTPTSDPQEVTIEYPKNQRIPQVFVTGQGVSFTQTAATTTDAVTVQRIDVGATKLASEVSDINAQNSIIVGGPCANAAAATVMGSPADCTEGFEPGVGLIKVFDVGTDNVAMLVAGYAAADTRNAAAVVANSGDYTLSGAAMEVTKVGSTLTVAEPTVAAPADDAGTGDDTGTV